MPAFNRDEFAAEYKARTSKAEVCMRGDLIVEHAELDAELLVARQAARDDMHNKRVSELRARVVELEEQIEASTRVFTFRALPHKVWQDIIAKHPPTPKQKAEDKGLDHNPITFPPAAIAAASLDPKLTEDDVNWLSSDEDCGLQFSEFQKLFGACLEANLAVIAPPKSDLAALIGALPRNGTSSTTAAPGGSPAASSSGASSKKAKPSGSKRTGTPRSPGASNSS